MPSRDDCTSPWVEGHTLSSVLRSTAARCPDHDAVVFPQIGVRWSWRELNAKVDEAAQALVAVGVENGEKLGIWSMNCPEWVVVQLAAARIGAVLVNVNPAYRLHELEDALRMADVATLVVGRPFKSSDFVGMVEALCPEIAARGAPGWTAVKLPNLRRVIAIDERPGPGWVTWVDLMAGGSRSDEWMRREAATRPLDVMNVQFTSGTTGLPKGAMLTHRNILMNAYHVGQRLRYTESDRVCVPVPFYHCFGCVLGTTVCVVYGSAIVVPAPAFEPAATLAAIERERCTSLYGVPTMFVTQLDHPDRPNRDLRSLRTGIMAGAPCPLPLMEAVVTKLAVPQITIGYGLTEASPIITETDVNDTIEVRVRTVGRPLPGLEVRLIHPLTGEEAAEGAPGELCVRGHGVMAGYYRNPAATQAVLSPEGWLRTGDLALRREDGCYRIVGRSKELIIRGGENIYPPEVEEFLCGHPAVAEAAVVGLPDPVYGEAVSAWIVLKPGANACAPEELRRFCHGQIAHFKIPKYLEIVEALPRTVTGKVRKPDLRQMGLERYQLSEVSEVPTA